MNRREASPTNRRKFRHLDCGFAGCPANERKRHFRISGPPNMSDKRTLSDILFIKTSAADLAREW